MIKHIDPRVDVDKNSGVVVDSKSDNVINYEVNDINIEYGSGGAMVSIKINNEKNNN